MPGALVGALVVPRLRVLRSRFLEGVVFPPGRQLLRRARSRQSSDFISLISLVMLSFASPKSIMHFSL